MWFWKKNKAKQPVVIKQECYDKLPEKHKEHFAKAPADSTHTHEVIHHDDSGENFGLSLAVGMATDSIGMGYIAGGSLMGAFIGEELAEHHHESASTDFGGYGGGDGGGGGATSDYGSSSDSSYSSSDSSSSYDSGSSMSDSSSSYDSGGSSSFDSGGF